MPELMPTTGTASEKGATRFSGWRLSSPVHSAYARMVAKCFFYCRTLVNRVHRWFIVWEHFANSNRLL